MNSANFILTAVVAAVVCAGLMLVLLPLLRRHVLAHPNTRSSHRVSTPQGGGAAVIAGTLGGAVLGLSAAGGVSHLWLVLAATVAIAAVGLIDDIWTIPVAPRLLLHTLAMVAVVASLPADVRVLPWPWWIDRVMLLIAGVWFVNLTNFMDGIDWMTVSEFVPLTAGLALLAQLGALPPDAAVVAVALFGALVGFAPFNRPVAQVFLGDVGSLPIGLLAAWLLIVLAGEGHIAAAIILPLYYVADATLTLLRRIARGERFWDAHRSHFYQQATDRGHSVPSIVARAFALNCGLLALAAVTVVWPALPVQAAALAFAAILVGWLLYCFARGKP